MRSEILKMPRQFQLIGQSATEKMGGWMLDL